MKLTLEEISQLQQAGEFQRAKEAYQAFLQDHPNHVEALHRFAFLYAEEGELEHARALLEQAIELDPDNPNLVLHLANILKAQGKIEEAKSELLLLTQHYPNSAAAFNNLGTVYFTNKEWKQAIEAYQRAIDLQSNFVDAYYNLGLAYTKDNQDPYAMSAFQAVLELSPEHPGARFQLAMHFMRRKNYQEALGYLLGIAKSFPFHFETQSNLAVCYLHLGDLQAAKKHYLQALEINENDLQILFNLGVIHMQQAEMESARQYYQRAIELQPDFMEAHNNLAIIYLGLNQREAAKKHFIEVLRLQSDNPAVQHTVNILNQRGDVASSPPEYIQTLFDSYADHYDSHLLGPLHYQVPQLLYAQVKNHLPNKPIAILDLGAGTGLSGEVFAAHIERLIGVDLSEKMLAIAAQKHLYNELIHTDIIKFMQATPERFDLVIAADVVVYFGDLSELFKQIATVLKPGGLCVFNTEISQAADFVLTSTGRFTHQPDYVKRLAAENHLTLLSIEQAVIRKHQEENVQGNIFLFQKRS